MCFYLVIMLSWLWMSHATFGFDFGLSTLPTRFAGLSGKVVANVLVIATWVVSRPRNPMYISPACVTTTNFVLSRYFKVPTLIVVSPCYGKKISLKSFGWFVFPMSRVKYMTLSFHNSLLNQTSSPIDQTHEGRKLLRKKIYLAIRKRVRIFEDEWERSDSSGRPYVLAEKRDVSFTYLARERHIEGKGFRATQRLVSSLARKLFPRVVLVASII